MAEKCQRMTVWHQRMHSPDTIHPVIKTNRNPNTQQPVVESRQRIQTVTVIFR